jgi:hypothetical protein
MYSFIYSIYLNYSNVRTEQLWCSGASLSASPRRHSAESYGNRLQEAECELNRAQVRVIMDSANVQQQEILPEKKRSETELSALVNWRLRLESKVQKMTAHLLRQKTIDLQALAQFQKKKLSS